MVKEKPPQIVIWGEGWARGAGRPGPEKANLKMRVLP
jgi:hypothetical protein